MITINILLGSYKTEETYRTILCPKNFQAPGPGPGPNLVLPCLGSISG